MVIILVMKGQRRRGIESEYLVDYDYLWAIKLVLKEAIGEALKVNTSLTGFFRW